VVTDLPLSIQDYISCLVCYIEYAHARVSNDYEGVLLPEYGKWNDVFGE
jgi:hypothetical protein